MIIAFDLRFQDHALAPGDWRSVDDRVGGGRFLILPGGARGSGLSGEVFKGVDLENDARPVAIKLLNGHPDDPTTKTYFEREMRGLARLNHPNIVDLVYAGLDSDRTQYFLALEWAEENLEEVFEAKPWSGWDELADTILLPLADALAYAHQRKVQHRDIKPSNILIADGVPKLADFSISKLADILDPAGRTVFGAQTPLICLRTWGPARHIRRTFGHLRSSRLKGCRVNAYLTWKQSKRRWQIHAFRQMHAGYFPIVWI